MNASQQLVLMIVSLAALILPGVSRWIGIPAVVMEILFGILIGKSLLNLAFGGDWLPFLAELGFLFLMFQAGMEIDFAALGRQSTGQFVLQLLLFLFTLATSLVAAWILSRGLFMALVLSTTSLGLVMPTLRETGLAKTELGQTILFAATLADFLTLFGITFFILYIQQGMGWHFLLPLPLFVTFGLLLRLGRLWAWWNPARAEQILGLTEDTHEIGVRLSIALLFLLVGLSELVHLEPVLGAFLGGALLAYVFKEKPLLEHKLSAVGFGFLIPVFFIHVGMQLDLRNLMEWRQIYFTLELLVFAMAVKLIPTLIFLFRGYSLRQVLQMGLLLSSRLSLIIAAAAIGLQQGLISEEIKDAIVLLAIVTCFLGPTLFKRLSQSTELSS